MVHSEIHFWQLFFVCFAHRRFDQLNQKVCLCVRVCVHASTQEDGQKSYK